MNVVLAVVDVYLTASTAWNFPDGELLWDLKMVILTIPASLFTKCSDFGKRFNAVLTSFIVKATCIVYNIAVNQIALLRNS